MCPLRSPVRSLASTHQPVESLPLHALLLVVALVVAIAAQGAYYGAGQRTVAVVLLLALLAGLPASPRSRDDALLPPVWAGAAYFLSRRPVSAPSRTPGYSEPHIMVASSLHFGQTGKR